MARRNEGLESGGNQLPQDSLYDAVMNDPDARHAYFHTTKGVLSGRRDDPDTLAVQARLDQEGVAFLFNPDNRARPLFLTSTGHGTIAGKQAIGEHITRLVAERDSRAV